MATIYLALGSNVGDSIGYIHEAIQHLAELVSELKQAPIYTSKAVGYTEQADFFNTVVQGQTQLEPLELLQFVKSIEQQVGRIKRFRWGPREIDIDIILYDKIILDTPALTIPHPRFTERDFVLLPLSKLAPNFIDPKSQQAISQLLAQLPSKELSILHAVPETDGDR